ncbi:MAG: hypothetical protein M5T61_01225 [Acidimicrobiia bacterium]|nr:hypothetical protein [Acidimicrobiia bacterium]
MLQQLGAPLGVGNVGLAARHVAHVASVDHPYLADRVFEHPVHRLPVHAGGFHPHQRHLPFDEPVRQHQQLRDGRAELGDLLAAAAATIGHAGARHHRVAVHIQERAPLDKYLHHGLLPLGNGVASRMGASPEETEVRARSNRTERPRPPGSS